MARKSAQKNKGGGRMLPVLHPDAAGVDIGAEEMFVAVPADRATDAVRSFGTFTRDLHELADWLTGCSNAVCIQSRWNQLECSGFRFIRSLKLAGFKCFWSTRST